MVKKGEGKSSQKAGVIHRASSKTPGINPEWPSDILLEINYVPTGVWRPRRTTTPAGEQPPWWYSLFRTRNANISPTTGNPGRSSRVAGGPPERFTFILAPLATIFAGTISVVLSPPISGRSPVKGRRRFVRQKPAPGRDRRQDESCAAR